MAYIKYKDITIDGIRSFKNKQKLILNKPPGLYLITGDNQVEPQLGGNGAGKSSCLDAFTLVQWGKSVNGLKGSISKNWKSKSGEIELNLEKDEVPFIIKRKISSSVITKIQDDNTNVISQEDYDNFIIDYDKAINSIIVGQKNLSFLDLGATDKLNMFSDIMGLTYWERCSKKATEILDSLTNKQNLVVNKITGIESRISTLLDQQTSLMQQNDTFAEEHRSQIIALKQQINSISIIITDKTKEQSVITQHITALSSELETNKTSIELDYSLKDETVNKQLSDSTTQKSIEVNNKNRLNLELNKWKQLVDICPYCLQPTNQDAISNNKRNLIKDILNCDKKIKLLEEQIIQLMNNREQIIHERGTQTLLLDNIKSKLTNYNNLLNIVNTSIKLKQQELNQLESKLAIVLQSENPFTKMLQDCNNNLDSSGNEKTNLIVEQKNIEKEILLAKHWVKGFKELRLWLVNDALLDLEIETSNALSKLGLMNWVIKFQMERETTKGDLSKGFHVLVKSPECPPDDKLIPLEAYSGGEGQRLKLATIIGLTSLIQNYKGINFNIMAWDEPSNYLSTLGVQALITYLADYAKTENKTIFFIDQVELHNPLFSGTINVVKTENGSIIQDSQ